MLLMETFLRSSGRRPIRPKMEGCGAVRGAGPAAPGQRPTPPVLLSCQERADPELTGFLTCFQLSPDP